MWKLSSSLSQILTYNITKPSSIHDILASTWIEYRPSNYFDPSVQSKVSKKNCWGCRGQGLIFFANYHYQTTSTCSSSSSAFLTAKSGEPTAADGYFCVPILLWNREHQKVFFFSWTIPASLFSYISFYKSSVLVTITAPIFI